MANEHPVAHSNALVSSEYRNKLFRIVPKYPDFGAIVGYITHEQDNGFYLVITSQLMTLPGEYPINCHGLWGKSTFIPNDHLDWLDTPEIMTIYIW